MEVPQTKHWKMANQHWKRQRLSIAHRPVTAPSKAAVYRCLKRWRDRARLHDSLAQSLSYMKSQVSRLHAGAGATYVPEEPHDTGELREG